MFACLRKLCLISIIIIYHNKKNKERKMKHSKQINLDKIIVYLVGNKI